MLGHIAYSLHSRLVLTRQDSIVMHGTARSFTPEVRDTVRTRVAEVAAGVGSGQGAEISTEWDDLNYGYPATINTAREARVCGAAAQDVVGPDGLRTGPEISATSVNSATAQSSLLAIQEPI